MYVYLFHYFNESECFFQFFENIIGPEMMKYFNQMKFSSFFLLACGAVVRESEALAGLEEVIKRYAFLFYLALADRSPRLRFTDAFAFGAENLITHYPALWMISYADQVIISGQPSKESIKNLLYTSGIGSHTSIFYFNQQLGEGPITVAHYVWEHKSQRPNTFSYPIGCPLCHSIYTWQSVPAEPAAKGTPFTLKCKKTLGNGEKCRGEWNIPGRPESEVVPNPYVGTWRKL